jgi:hypothetical protein
MLQGSPFTNVTAEHVREDGAVQQWYGISIREGNILNEMSNCQLLKNQCALVS